MPKNAIIAKFFQTGFEATANQAKTWGSEYLPIVDKLVRLNN